MLKQLENYIQSGNFKEAEKLYQRMDFQQFDDEIILSAYDNRNILYYTFYIIC